MDTEWTIIENLRLKKLKHLCLNTKFVYEVMNPDKTVDTVIEYEIVSTSKTLPKYFTSSYDIMPYMLQQNFWIGGKPIADFQFFRSIKEARDVIKENILIEKEEARRRYSIKTSVNQEPFN